MKQTRPTAAVLKAAAVFPPTEFATFLKGAHGWLKKRGGRGEVREVVIDGCFGLLQGNLLIVSRNNSSEKPKMYVWKFDINETWDNEGEAYWHQLIGWASFADGETGDVMLRADLPIRPIENVLKLDNLARREIAWQLAHPKPYREQPAL